jgi:hypothetical protein
MSKASFSLVMISFVDFKTAICSSKDPRGGPEVAVLESSLRSVISRSTSAIPKEDRSGPIEKN